MKNQKWVPVLLVGLMSALLFGKPTHLTAGDVTLETVDKGEAEVKTKTIKDRIVLNIDAESCMENMSNLKKPVVGRGFFSCTFKSDYKQQFAEYLQTNKIVAKNIRPSSTTRGWLDYFSIYERFVLFDEANDAVIKAGHADYQQFLKDHQLSRVDVFLDSEGICLQFTQTALTDIPRIMITQEDLEKAAILLHFNYEIAVDPVTP